jgi:hypothetical protein
MMNPFSHQGKHHALASSITLWRIRLQGVYGSGGYRFKSCRARHTALRVGRRLIRRGRSLDKYQQSEWGAGLIGTPSTPNYNSH